MFRCFALIAVACAACDFVEPSFRLDATGVSAEFPDAATDAGLQEDASATNDAEIIPVEPIDVDAGTADTGVPPPPLDSCIPSARHGRQTLSCNGLTFNLDVPLSCTTGCGLIVDIHGFSMNGAMEDANTNLALLGEQFGYVVVQPNGTPRPPWSSWNVADDDDVLDFIERVTRIYAIDLTRVHATGFSQGGYMVWRFACEHADMFASMAPAAAASGCASGANLGDLSVRGCSFVAPDVPSRSLDILYLHGKLEQNYVPFSCAETQAAALIAHHALQNETVIASDMTYSRKRWAGADGKVFELLEHSYSSPQSVAFVSNSALGGHCFPGSEDPGNQAGQLFSFKCEDAASFRWGEEVMRFFVDHPRR